MKRHKPAAVIAACLVLTGCGAVVATSGLLVSRDITAAITSPGFLYVASAGATPDAPKGAVVVYAGSSSTPARTLTQNIDTPGNLAIDNEHRLFVLNVAGQSVSIYRRDGSYLRSLTRGINFPSNLELSSRDDLYLVRRWHDINVYPSARQGRLKHLKPNGGLYSLALDASGDLYAGGIVVFVYPPGASQPSRTISNGVVQAVSLAVDESGNLYVGNNGGNSCGNIEIYPPNQNTPSRSITNGVCNPVKMIFDNNGNLYVANVAWGGVQTSVTVYPSGSGTPTKTITAGVSRPVALALDPSGNLYVANQAANDVTVYDSGSTAVSRTLTDEISNPSDLVWSTK